jgi:hypothetical protein
VKRNETRGLQKLDWIVNALLIGAALLALTRMVYA